MNAAWTLEAILEHLQKEPALGYLLKQSLYLVNGGTGGA
jgi:hypothetical protein